MILIKIHRIHSILFGQAFDLPNIPDNVNLLQVSNCYQINVRPETLNHLPNLRSVYFHNIENLVLESGSLRFDPSTLVELSFAKVSMTTLPSDVIDGNIFSIQFIDCFISTFNGQAIANIPNVMNKLLFQTTEIVNFLSKGIDAIATEELELWNLTIHGSIATTAFNNIEVTKSFRIRNCNFNSIMPNAFSMKGECFKF